MCGGKELEAFDMIDQRTLTSPKVVRSMRAHEPVVNMLYTVARDCSSPIRFHALEEDVELFPGRRAFLIGSITPRVRIYEARCFQYLDSKVYRVCYARERAECSSSSV